MPLAVEFDSDMLDTLGVVDCDDGIAGAITTDYAARNGVPYRYA